MLIVNESQTSKKRKSRFRMKKESSLTNLIKKNQSCSLSKISITNKFK